MKVKIDGMRSIIRALDRLSSIQQEKALEMGLARGGAAAVEIARGLVPIDSGDLRDNLHVGGYTKLTPGYRAIGAYGTLRRPIGRGKVKGVLVGTKLPYAHLVEMGTRHSRPQPFLRTAVDLARGRIVSEVEKAVQEVIET